MQCWAGTGVEEEMRSDLGSMLGLGGQHQGASIVGSNEWTPWGSQSLVTGEQSS